MLCPRCIYMLPLLVEGKCLRTFWTGMFICNQSELKMNTRIQINDKNQSGRFETFFGVTRAKNHILYLRAYASQNFRGIQNTNNPGSMFISIKRTPLITISVNTQFAVLPYNFILWLHSTSPTEKLNNLFCDQYHLSKMPLTYTMPFSLSWSSFLIWSTCWSSPWTTISDRVPSSATINLTLICSFLDARFQ